MSAMHADSMQLKAHKHVIIVKSSTLMLVLDAVLIVDVFSLKSRT